MVKWVVSWVSVRSLSQSWEVGYRVGGGNSCPNASNRFAPTKIRCFLNPLLCFMYPLDYNLLSLCYNALHSETLPIPIDT